MPKTIEFDTLVQLDPKDLKPRERNVKVHTPSQIEAIKGSIRGLGFNDPIVLDRDGYILEGHGRRLAVLELGMDSVPVIYKDIGGVEADAYAIIHNSTTLETGMDMDAAMTALQEAGLTEDDALLAGISNVEWDLNTGINAQSDQIYFGNDVEDEDAASLGTPVKRVIMKFATEEEYDKFRKFLLWLKSKFPSEETNAGRVSKYIAVCKKAGL